MGGEKVKKGGWEKGEKEVEKIWIIAVTSEGFFFFW